MSSGRKVALITGVMGQDGWYLLELLLQKGYDVHGIELAEVARRADGLYRRAAEEGRFHLHAGDLTDSAGLCRIVSAVRPDEIYNLAAQSQVKVSFQQPEMTADIDALGPLRLLEAVRSAGLAKQTRFFQASTAELFGQVAESPQRETTALRPRNPYAASKMFAHWIIVIYRESYGMHACNGIMFNHESPRRGELFVTRKITRGLARIRAGLDTCVRLGNMSAKRDWGYARDYVEAMWLMLQAEKAGDYVIATGEQHSVRDFVDAAAVALGMGPLRWEGSGVEEKAYWGERCVVCVDPAFFRPSEVDALVGDSSLARRELGWRPRVLFQELVAEMAREDLKAPEAEAAAAAAAGFGLTWTAY